MCASATLFSLSTTRNKVYHSQQNMGCKLNSLEPPILCRVPVRKPSFRTKIIAFSSYASNRGEAVSTSKSIETQRPNTDVFTVRFKTLGACKLGISRYPDFEYNAEVGTGTGTGTKIKDANEISVSFDLNTLNIPPLTSATTKFLGLPLPPLLKIDTVPQLFRGNINQESGKVDLDFLANFCFSVGSIYRAPPLLVKIVLTSEESKGKLRSGRGERLDGEGNCKLVGVASVDPIDDFFPQSSH